MKLQSSLTHIIKLKLLFHQILANWSHTQVDLVVSCSTTCRLRGFWFCCPHPHKLPFLDKWSIRLTTQWQTTATVMHQQITQLKKLLNHTSWQCQRRSPSHLPWGEFSEDHLPGWQEQLWCSSTHSHRLLGSLELVTSTPGWWDKPSWTMVLTLPMKKVTLLENQNLLLKLPWRTQQFQELAWELLWCFQPS